MRKKEDIDRKMYYLASLYIYWYFLWKSSLGVNSVKQDLA